MPPSLHSQAEQFYSCFADLIRAYQFRDRESVCCHDLSVTQCYALEALERVGPMRMGVLAEHLNLEVSSMTRAIEPLVARRLVTRREGEQDRRVREVRITRQGRALVARVQADLVAEYERVLRRIPSASRGAVIETVGHLLRAFEERSACGAAPSEQTSARPTQGRQS